MDNQEMDRNNDDIQKNSGFTSKEELAALLKHFVGNNTVRINELQELSMKVRDENEEACNGIAEALLKYKAGNSILTEALKELEK